MEKIEKIDVLDKGFVRLVDHMGDDNRVVESARLSVKDAKTRTENEALIRYLMRHHHTSPFEMVKFTFHVKMPIVMARQHMRHRMANINEMSGRYSVLPEEFYVPDLSELKKQSKENHQGVSEETLAYSVAAEIQTQMQNSSKKCFSDYEVYLSQDLAKEMARINLPLSTYTEFYWTVDLHNLFHYLRLRIDSHSQKQIRDYANAFFKLIKQIVPISCSAFEDYRLNALSLTKYDIECVGKMLKGGDVSINRQCFPTKREFDEFLQKIELFGIKVDRE